MNALKADDNAGKLDQTKASQSVSREPKYDLSVIVPTYNRAESLERLIRSLDSLEALDSISLEVLVVNNGSTDATSNLLAREQANPRRYHLAVLLEERRGQSAAINLGLQCCAGRLICLLDDDVVVDPGWARGIIDSYRQSDFDALQGRVLPGVDPQGNLADPRKLYYYNIPLVDEGDRIKPRRGLTGAHMTAKREVFEAVGYFDYRLGPGASGFSGDTDFSRRTRAAGFKIGYTPYAAVYHELNPARYGRTYNRRVQFQKGLSRSIYRRDSIWLHVLPNLFANGLRFCLYSLAGNARKAYVTEGRIFRWLGYLRGKIKS